MCLQHDGDPLVLVVIYFPNPAGNFGVDVEFDFCFSFGSIY